jgi:hypothetical protein
MIFGVYPWPCRSEESYLHAIRTTPLKFPYNVAVSAQTKDFISRCLVYKEADRMGWD